MVFKKPNTQKFNVTRFVVTSIIKL
jgi:hypothetical protein